MSIRTRAILILALACVSWAALVGLYLTSMGAAQ
jgi:hypothetical protein